MNNKLEFNFLIISLLLNEIVILILDIGRVYRFGIIDPEFPRYNPKIFVYVTNRVPRGRLCILLHRTEKKKRGEKEGEKKT